MFKTPLFWTASAAIIMLSGNLSAKPKLHDVTHVREGLITVGIAYEISEQCDGISARLFRGIVFLNGLKSHARDLGFSSAEVDAYTDDKEEQNRLEAIARERLAGLGAVAGDTETYCSVGRAEIAAQSPIGRLLR